MKKILYLSGIFLFILSMVQPAVAGPLNSVDQQVYPPPTTPDQLANPVYLPAVMAPLITYTVSGQIKKCQRRSGKRG